ncbi:MAG: hypothetical protein QXR84_09255 [Candidatus Bathyarchaeia archaeon]
MYLSKNPKLAEIFRILLSDINEKCEYYRVKSREAETSLTPPEFEDLQYIPETWISRIERIISYLAPSKTVNINIIDPKNQQYSLSLTLNEGMRDAVSRTLRHMPRHVVYRIGERRLGPRYSRKSLFELDIEPGSTIRIEPAVGELIPSRIFDRPVILRGGQTINVGGTFIVGRIWGERLGIRMFPRDMYVGQLMDEIQGDVEKTFSADTRGWIKDKCPPYVSRVHAVIYQKDSVFYFLDVSLNGTLLISDGEEKDIRSGRDEFSETGQITPYRLSSNNTVKLFGTSFDIIISH